jgi:hypothetical protein
MVHSFIVQGKINIGQELRRYHPNGELRGFRITYPIPS